MAIPIWALKALMGILGAGAINAKNEMSTDQWGNNGTDRDYMKRLRDEVKSGNMSEDEAKAHWESRGGSPEAWDAYAADASGSPAGFTKNSFLENIGAKYFGMGLTDSEKMANAYNTSERIAAQEFNAAEAQKSRDFTLYMQRNKYSMETQSMQDAGVNPAMVYGGGNLVPTAANGATASVSGAHSVAPSGGDASGIIAGLMNLVRLPQELKNLKQEYNESKAREHEHEANASAATENANTNRMNAFTNQWNAFTNSWNANSNERQAAVAEARVQIERALANSNIRVNEQTVNKLAEDTAYVHETRQYISKYYDIAKQNANSQQLQALAAMRSADAAVQNAATNDYKAGYETDLMWSQRLLNDIAYSAGTKNLEYLDAEKQAQIEEMRQRGYFFNQQGQLCDKQGHLVDAQTAKTYTDLACDVAVTTCKVAGTIVTGGFGGATATPIGFQ